MGLAQRNDARSSGPLLRHLQDECDQYRASRLVEAAAELGDHRLVEALASLKERCCVDENDGNAAIARCLPTEL
ncbi:MAG TPA: hypothetical protein VGM37_03065 [Armatimonadota bacterium]